MSFLCYELGVHKFRDEHTRELPLWERTMYIRYQRCQRCHGAARELNSAKPPRRIRPYRNQTQ